MPASQVHPGASSDGSHKDLAANQTPVGGKVSLSSLVPGAPSKAGTLSAPQICIEPCTPVSATCMQRAMNPPPSIRSFFKPVSSASSTSQSSNGTGACSNGDRAQVHLSATSDDCESTPSARQPLVSVDNGDARIVGSDGSSDDEVCVITKTSAGPSSSSENRKTKASGLASAAPAAKRPRQSSLLTVFSKASASQKEEKRKKNVSNGSSGSGSCSGAELPCPICQKSFPKTFNNIALNAHIDKCLKAKAC